jgi:hypothetical protein
MEEKKAAAQFEFDPDTKPKGGATPNMMAPPMVIGPSQPLIMGDNQFEEYKQAPLLMIPPPLFEYQSSDQKPGAKEKNAYLPQVMDPAVQQIARRSSKKVATGLQTESNHNTL